MHMIAFLGPVEVGIGRIHILGAQLNVGLDMRHQFNGGISGRHGDRSVKRSTLLPYLHQLLSLVFCYPPHFEVNSDGIIDCSVTLFFIRISPGFYPYIHPF